MPVVLEARLRQLGFTPANVEPFSREERDLSALFGLKTSGNTIVAPQGAGSPPGRIMVFTKPHAGETEEQLLKAIEPHLADYRTRNGLETNEIAPKLSLSNRVWTLYVQAAAGTRL